VAFIAMSKRVDYDSIAAQYGNRYEQTDYAGVKQALATFVAKRSGACQVLEAGCGTGHWVQFLHDAGVGAVGLDPSRGMLHVARTRLPNGSLVRAWAEALPFRRGSFDRIVCIHALHHFVDPAGFFHEARRVLCAGGGLLTVGLDPHTGQDRWWIYGYFPEALVEDRRRYPPTKAIRELMEAAGFRDCETRVIQHLSGRITVSEAVRRGFLDRTSTSQLMVISEAAYNAGLDRVHAANADALGENCLHTDLRLYGTIGWAA
jgi:ubiquinone/menaquinone biosynthesis C-methylase UbiE